MAKTFADTPLLRNDEKAQFVLRELYQRYGYTRFKMSKFEEYELYVRNKGFLVSGNIISFTDTDGIQYRYRVEYSETIEGRDVEQMFSGGSSEWDLTLFTCTLSGRSRVTVRASLIKE